jgi:hypothetical protein
MSTAASVIVQYGTYQCSVCGSALQFEPCDITKASFAVGFCTRGHECYNEEHMASNCRMWKVRLKIPIDRIGCDILPQEPNYANRGRNEAIATEKP